MDETGLEPVIVSHPQGALVPGAYPSQEADITAPPSGWLWDAARGMLIPALASSRGDCDAARIAMKRLSGMEWVLDPLPGIEGQASLHNITCLDFEDSVARLEAVAVARRGTSAVLEINDEAWLILPQEVANLMDSTHWERSRRYLLEEAVLAGEPALEALLA